MASSVLRKVFGIEIENTTKALAREFTSLIFSAESRAAAKQTGERIIADIAEVTGLSAQRLAKMERNIAAKGRAFNHNTGIRSRMTKDEAAYRQAGVEVLENAKSHVTSGGTADDIVIEMVQKKGGVKNFFKAQAQKIVDEDRLLAPEGWVEVKRGVFGKFMHTVGTPFRWVGRQLGMGGKEGLGAGTESVYIREASEYSFFKLLNNAGVISRGTSLQMSSRLRGTANAILGMNSYAYNAIHRFTFGILRTVSNASDNSVLGRFDNWLYRRMSTDVPAARNQFRTFVARTIALAGVAPLLAFVLRKGSDKAGFTDQYYDAHKPDLATMAPKAITKEYLKPMLESIDAKALDVLAADLGVEKSTLLDPETGQVKEEYLSNEAYMIAMSAGQLALSKSFSLLPRDENNPMSADADAFEMYISGRKAVADDVAAQKVLFATDHTVPILKLAPEEIHQFMDAALVYYKEAGKVSRGGLAGGENVRAKDMAKFAQENMGLEADKQTGDLKTKEKTKAGRFDVMKDMMGVDNISSPIQWAIFAADMPFGGFFHQTYESFNGNKTGSLPKYMDMELPAPEEVKGSIAEDVRMDLVTDYKRLREQERQLRVKQGIEKAKKDEVISQSVEDLQKSVAELRQSIQQKTVDATSSRTGSFAFTDPAKKTLNLDNMNIALANATAIAPRVNLSDDDVFMMLTQVSKGVDEQKRVAQIMEWEMSGVDFLTSDPGFVIPQRLMFRNDDKFLNNETYRTSVLREEYAQTLIDFAEAQKKQMEDGVKQAQEYYQAGMVSAEEYNNAQAQAVAQYKHWQARAQQAKDLLYK